MAEMRFVLYDINENPIVAENVISFEWSRDISAPCDALRLRFYADKALPEINRAEAYAGNKKIFSGYCDTQRESRDADGFSIFLYARSSACLLLDSEAEPFTYTNPSAHALYLLNAHPLGFTSCLPALCCESDYIVSKGTSCYGAVNSFVYALTSKNIAVSPDDVLYLPSGGDEVTISENDILSEKRVLNRGKVITAVDYKAEGDTAYSHHLKSQSLEAIGCRRTRKLNLTALPEWQRSCTLLGSMKNAAADYYTIELTLAGCIGAELYDTVRYKSELFGDISGYYISSFCVVCDAKGERTQFVINRPIDLKEITYVA